jgi:hypothetical protein
MPLNIFANELSKDYCIGYFEEVYWSLDPIEEEETRMNITRFFNDSFEGADQLNFDLYYNPQQKQFMNDFNSEDLIQYTKVNYPNFEIIILDAYINLFMEGDDYCPAFWNNCSEESLNSFFQATIDFSNTWTGEENVIDFLENNFKDHKCIAYLRTYIEKEKFTKDLNILIDQLTD